ncbi:nitrite reductase [Shewanella schlegeliana]|uniref:Nitrite reductase n=1 Tax=Shewanella schlegeliana TaxID=190308 RepID=A0ABS1T4W3_9GAMM|nr:nitrite reductase [Shewanella schlegeliana]MBL4914882.1 nitrite reductase [Shewanella schlegeliana]MCL1110427.1 nitrite reductase [Shewanella schlegeliana]GIU27712.1 nitrite reductase [Shewanella schlegeliana]
MNSLAIGIAVTLGAVITLIWRHHHSSQKHGVTLIAEPNAEVFDMDTTGIKVPMALSVVLFTSTLLIYSQLGHFDGWNKGVVDENIDYLITAEINKNAKKVNEQPSNEIALLNLAQSYVDGGLYSESVQTLDELLTLSGDSATVLGMKANAMYYRDKREMSLDIDLVIARALALDEYEPQSRLLLATHAYLNSEYEKAIEQWLTLLKSDKQNFNRASINNAIYRAEQKIANRSVAASE